MRFEERMKWLLVDPTFAILPRICMFSGIRETDLEHLGSQYPNGPLVYQSMLSAFKAALTLMQGLRVVRLEDIDIDEEVLNALVQLPRLKDIRLQSPDITCHKFTPLIAVEDVSLMEWSFKSPYTQHPLELFSNKQLKNLDVQSYRYNSSILEHLISQGQSELLTTLSISIDIRIIPTLMAFLKTCPQLTTLSARRSISTIEFYPAYPSLPSSALPNLHTYSGVGSLAAMLVSNRPLRCVTILDNWSESVHESRAASILSQLSKSSAVIRHLSLPPLHPQPHIFHEILKTFPHLKLLELRFPVDTVVPLRGGDNDSIPDDAYFDLTTASEIPPIEVDEEGCPITPPTSLRGLMEWLCVNKLPLSRSIRSLAVLQQIRPMRGINHMFKTYLAFREQYRFAGMLSTHFPALKNLTFGREHIQWVCGDDGVWAPAFEYGFYIRHRNNIPSYTGAAALEV